MESAVKYNCKIACYAVTRADGAVWYIPELGLTKESMAVKNKLHPIYEKSRNMKKGSPERIALENQMREISATLPMPKGIDELKNYEEC